ncbi:MAG: FxSxx-COOH system tetratricopeptide repeat protein [Bryobacteraceae bacterium]
MVELHEKLFLTRATALTHGSVIALPALGGVGKTTLARHYAEKFWRCYRQIFWVDCRLGLATGFARVYDFLHPGEEMAVPFETRAQRAKDELSQHADERLLILDNAEDEQSVLPWIPETGNCHVLITSRFAGWSKGIETYPVWVLEQEPARRLLLERSGRASDDGEEAAAAKVAERLQYLPLALEQAAAYVAEQTGFGFEDYLRRYETSEKAFLDRRTPGATDYPESVYLTWRTTVDRLPEGARAMLRLHAFVAPTPFPVQLYIEGAKELGAEIEAWGAAPAELPDEMTVRDWKTSLVKYSMAKAEPEDCISVHALVQAVERHAMAGRSPEAAAGSARRAAALFSRVTPWPSWELISRALWEKLASHAEILAANGYVEDELRGTVLAKLAEASRYAGNYATGVERARRALEAGERVLGREHPNTLTLVNNLAFLLSSKGDYDGAEPLYRRALEAQERVLGHEHPNTLTSVNNLASLIENKGDYDAAEPLYRRALEARERMLGREHPDTLSSVNNLALLLDNKGDYDAAEPLFRRALEAWERVLGREHPHILTSINNLALLFYRKGDYGAAEPLFRRALETRERVLGHEHPDTLGSVNNLAALIKNKGDYDAAVPLYRRALEASERVLGREHPDTLTSVNNLAALLYGKGDYDAAEPLFRRALEGRERVLGGGHPDTLNSINNLALLLYNKGDYDSAEPLFRRAAKSTGRILGPNHSQTKLFVQNHAGCLAAMAAKPAP